MSYSIKHTNVVLTTEQFRFVLTGLEAIRDGETVAGPEERAKSLLQYLKDQDVLNEHDYPYGVALTATRGDLPLPLPTECGLVFVNDLREEREDAGEVTNYRYRTDMLWKVRDGSGFEVRRIWAEGALIYGEGTKEPVEGVRVFYGDRYERLVFASDRVPPSATRPALKTDVLQVVKGDLDVLVPVEVPAGACHIALVDYDLSPHANRIPLISAEVVYRG